MNLFKKNLYRTSKILEKFESAQHYSFLDDEPGLAEEVGSVEGDVPEALVLLPAADEAVLLGEQLLPGGAQREGGLNLKKDYSTVTHLGTKALL